MTLHSNTSLGQFSYAGINRAAFDTLLTALACTTNSSNNTQVLLRARMYLLPSHVALKEGNQRGQESLYSISLSSGGGSGRIRGRPPGAEGGFQSQAIHCRFYPVCVSQGSTTLSTIADRGQFPVGQGFVDTLDPMRVTRDGPRR
jgi:hypothetical protein